MSNVPAMTSRQQDDGKLIVEDARILFRNFTGKEGKYNQEGQRNFCLILDPGVVEQMIRDGWNVKQLRARDDGDQGDFYIQVSVGFNYKPPTMVLITSKGRVRLSEDECAIFDWVDIEKVDVIVRPYSWDVNGNKGIKAYLQSLYLTMQEDYLDRKYADVPEVDRAGQPLELEAGNQEPETFIDSDGSEVVIGEIVED